MTVSTKVISVVYPVTGGAGAALATRSLLNTARQFVVGKSKTPSGRGNGRTAFVWTALSWAVAGGVGLYAGKKLVRPAPLSSPGPLNSMVAVQPAQSKQ